MASAFGVPASTKNSSMRQIGFLQPPRMQNVRSKLPPLFFILPAACLAGTFAVEEEPDARGGVHLFEEEHGAAIVAAIFGLIMVAVMNWIINDTAPAKVETRHEEKKEKVALS